MIVKIPLKPELLVKVIRGNTIEAVHYGWVCVINKNQEVIYKKGNINDLTFLRSALKPIQAVPVLENSINVSSKELAIICGSHSGSRKHLSVLKDFMDKQGLKISALKCGIHLPFDSEENKKIVSGKIKLNQLHNNCSGKHLGMLAVCKKNNWDMKTYLNPAHPIQRRIKEIIETLSATKKIEIAIDGCSAPTFALPIINIAKMFSDFTQKLNYNYSRIISSISKNPYYIGSNEQIDTEIIRCSGGKLIAKVGAEGIIVVAFNGNCAVVKIADGTSRARSFVVLKLLSKLKWLKQSRINDSVLEQILNGNIKNHSGTVVGKMVDEML